jgi:hypothetical protein
VGGGRAVHGERVGKDVLKPAGRNSD